MIISNASPLIHLTRLGKIDPLLRLHEKIIIPRAVFKEVIEDGIKAGFSDAVYLNGLMEKRKIEVEDIKNHDPELRSYLHPGEYESVQLARELKIPVLIDDRKARTVASNLQVSCATCLSAMLDLFEKGVIDHDHFVQNLNAYGTRAWVSSEVLDLYLREAKEIFEKKKRHDNT
jgi:predicted nucleic acid-binding protein